MENNLQDLDRKMEQSWKEMEHQLDIHLPVRKKSKLAILVIFTSILILFGIATYLFYLNSSSPSIQWIPSQVPLKKLAQIPSTQKINAVMDDSSNNAVIAENETSSRFSAAPRLHEKNSQPIGFIISDRKLQTSQRVHTTNEMKEYAITPTLTSTPNSQVFVNELLPYTNNVILPLPQYASTLPFRFNKPTIPLPPIVDRFHRPASQDRSIKISLGVHGTYLSRLQRVGVGAFCSSTIPLSRKFMVGLTGGYIQFLNGNIDSSNTVLQKSLSDEYTQIENNQHSTIHKIKNHNQLSVQANFIIQWTPKLQSISGIQYARSRYTLSNTLVDDPLSIPTKIVKESPVEKTNFQCYQGIQYQINQRWGLRGGLHWLEWDINNQQINLTHPSYHMGIIYFLN